MIAGLFFIVVHYLHLKRCGLINIETGGMALHVGLGSKLLMLVLERLTGLLVVGVTALLRSGNVHLRFLDCSSLLLVQIELAWEFTDDLLALIVGILGSALSRCCLLGISLDHDALAVQVWPRSPIFSGHTNLQILVAVYSLESLGRLTLLLQTRFIPWLFVNQDLLMGGNLGLLLQKRRWTTLLGSLQIGVLLRSTRANEICGAAAVNELLLVNARLSIIEFFAQIMTLLVLFRVLGYWLCQF